MDLFFDLLFSFAQILKSSKASWVGLWLGLILAAVVYVMLPHRTSTTLTCIALVIAGYLGGWACTIVLLMKKPKGGFKSLSR